MNRYSQAPSTGFPAPGRRRDRRSRKARSRRRADLAPRRGRLCGLTRPLPLVPVLAAVVVETIEKVVETVRNALVQDLVVHGAQLLPETGLDVAAQFCRLGSGLLAGGGGFHRVLLSHGLTLVHWLSPQPPCADRGIWRPLRVFCRNP